MELLIHVNKRIKCRNEVQLPVETLLQLYSDPKANSFIIVSNIYIVKIDFLYYCKNCFIYLNNGFFCSQTKNQIIQNSNLF